MMTAKRERQLQDRQISTYLERVYASAEDESLKERLEKINKSTENPGQRVIDLFCSGDSEEAMNADNDFWDNCLFEDLYKIFTHLEDTVDYIQKSSPEERAERGWTVPGSFDEM